MKHVARCASTLGLLAALLGGCSDRFHPDLTPYTEAAPTVIGPGYRAWEARISWKEATVIARAYVKLTDIDGKLGMCGAYVYDGAADLYSDIPAYFKSPISYVVIRGAGGLQANLRTYALADDDLHEIGPQPHGTLPARCVVTGIAWQESDAAASVELHLDRDLGLRLQGATPQQPTTGLMWIPVFVPRR